MSETEEEPEVEEIEESEEKHSEEESEKPLTRKDIEDIFNKSLEKRFPRKPAKTRAESKPEKKESEPDRRICPNCHDELTPIEYKGEFILWCKRCYKTYAV
jgi:hypothetical protein